jgi:hypothetical protein
MVLAGTRASEWAAVAAEIRHQLTTHQIAIGVTAATAGL